MGRGGFERFHCGVLKYPAFWNWCNYVESRNLNNPKPGAHFKNFACCSLGLNCLTISTLASEQVEMDLNRQSKSNHKEQAPSVK